MFGESYRGYFMCTFSEHMRHQLSARDYRMAKTICKVCMGYLVCNMPIMIYKHTRGKNANDSPYLKLAFATLYWFQCSFNFIIYAASNKQYREAYFMFLRVAVFKLDEDPYFTTITSNRGTNRRKTTERQSQPSGNSTGSGKPLTMTVASPTRTAPRIRRVPLAEESCRGSPGSPNPAKPGGQRAGTETHESVQMKL